MFKPKLFGQTLPKTTAINTKAAVGQVDTSQSFAKTRPLVLFVIMASALFVLLAAAGLIHQALRSNTYCQKTPTKVCILQKAPPLLAANQIEQLNKLLPSVYRVSGYQRDADMMFIIVTYYINMSDASNAKANFDRLVAVYDPNLGIDERLTQKVADINTLQQQVDYLQTNAANAKNNVQYGPPAQ